MKKVLALFLLTVFIVPSALAQDDVLKQAYKLYDEEKYEEGLALVNEAFEKDGESSRLLQARFCLLTALDRHHEALKAAIRRDKIAERKSPWNCMDVVQAYLSLDKGKKAMDWLEEAVERGFISYRSLSDEDYDSIRETKRFQELLDGIKETVGIDKPAKDFTISLLDGTEYTLSDQKGKVVLVDFWATWCGPCKREMPNLKTIFAEHGDDGFDIIGISLDRKQEDLDEYIAEEELGWKFSYSGEAWSDATVALYGVNSIPSVWLVDKEGVLREFGLRDEALAEAVAELVAE